MTTTPKALPETREYKMHPDRCRVACSRESCTCAPNRFDWEARPLVDRLSDEADQCRNDGANDIAALLDEAVQALNASTPADSLASAGGVDDWLPIALAQEDELCIVFWLDKSDPDHPERYEFDYLEEGVWLHHHDNYEHYMMVGVSIGPGPSEKAPYTHFKRLHAPGAQSALSKEREVADGLRAQLDEARRMQMEALEAVRSVMEDAYNRRTAVCCGQAQVECCGNFTEAWTADDMSIMDKLHPIEQAMSKTLTAHRESRGAASEAKEG